MQLRLLCRCWMQPTTTVFRSVGSIGISSSPSTACCSQATGVVQTVKHGTNHSHHAQVPDDILHDAALNDAIAVLPSNYNFEVCRPPQSRAHRNMCHRSTRACGVCEAPMPSTWRCNFPRGSSCMPALSPIFLERYEGPARCMSTTLPCSVALCIHEPPTTCGCTATTAPSALLV